MLDQIYSYREMCDIENIQTLQRGMNFRMNPRYSVILMSRRSNAPYFDRILEDGIRIEYEGHDEPKISYEMNPKSLNQPDKTKNGTLTQNGKFIDAVQKYKKGINVFVFLLKLSDNQSVEINTPIDLEHTRLIPSEVKNEVWKRDNGKCVICGSTKNLHFDHDLPFSKGGTSLTAKNIRLLCAKCNLAKSDKIE